MMRLDHIIRDKEDGYTLVEMLVAGALLVAVLIPTLLFLGKTVYNTKAGDTMAAAELGRARMEESVAGELFKKIGETKRINHKSFLLQQDVQEKDGLLFISVSVYREKDISPLITFKKCQMVR